MTDEDRIFRFLGTLEERIKTQLSHEYSTQEQVDYHFDNMTIPDLLRMLSYMAPQ